jgi:hypothetical protein
VKFNGGGLTVIGHEMRVVPADGSRRGYVKRDLPTGALFTTDAENGVLLCAFAGARRKVGETCLSPFTATSPLSSHFTVAFAVGWCQNDFQYLWSVWKTSTTCRSLSTNRDYCGGGGTTFRWTADDLELIRVCRNMPALGTEEDGR